MTRVNGNGAPPRRSLETVRTEFPGSGRWTYLDVGGRALLPLGTRQAVERDLDERMYDGGDKAAMFARVESARARFAAMIRAAPDEVAITKNISEGLNIVGASFPWKRGDAVVVCTDREHPNNVYPWLSLARRFGIEVRRVPSRDGRIDPDDMIAAIDARTRIVTTSSVSFLPGLRTDLSAIGQACRDRDILFLVDAAQSIGILDLDVGRIPVDAVAVSTQKGLLGLYGMGFLYCRTAWAERLTPAYLARFGIDLGDAHEAEGGSPDYRLMPAARRFDLGNYNFPGATAADASLELLAEIGVPAIERHVVGLARRLAEGLDRLGLPVWGLPFGDHFANMVTLGRPEGVLDPLASLYEHLSAHGVKLSVRQGFLRFSFHLYNTDEDVERVLDLAAGWTKTAPAASAAPSPSS